MPYFLTNVMRIYIQNTDKLALQIERARIISVKS